MQVAPLDGKGTSEAARPEVVLRDVSLMGLCVEAGAGLEDPLARLSAL